MRICAPRSRSIRARPGSRIRREPRVSPVATLRTSERLSVATNSTIDSKMPTAIAATKPKRTVLAQTIATIDRLQSASRSRLPARNCRHSTWLH